MQEAARISGNNPELLVRLGEMNLEQGQIAQAQAQADLALNNNRQQADAWQLRAKIASDQGQLQEAMQFYHRSLMAQTDNPPVQLALAELYQRMNRPQRALATLERMSDLRSPESQSATAWLLKGQAMASLGQTNEAKVCLVQATQQANCDDCQTFLQIAQLNAQLGQVAEARIYLGQVLSRQPAHPEALALQSHLQQHFQATWQDGLITNTTPTIDTVPVSAPIVSPGPALIEDNPAATLQTPK
jgi:tetratricopeptide (TPR) repeat protein